MPIPPAIIKKIQTLAPIAADLRHGQHFNITRLMILKGLCAEPRAATKFALHIAKLAQKKMKPAKSAKQQNYRRLATAGVRALAAYLKRPTEKAKEGLWDLHAKARQAQSRYEHQRWGAILGPGSEWRVTRRDGHSGRAGRDVDSPRLCPHGQSQRLHRRQTAW